MSKRKIYISPSDQTANSYAAGNTTEAVQCRKIAKSLVSALERCGFSAKTNVTAGMQARVAESNAWGADLHICVHTNAFNKSVSGTRLFCYSLNSDGYKACQSVMATLAPITPGSSDNIKARPELYETRATKCPCVYVEVDFHDVDEVALWIIDHTDDISEAIAKGVCNYYGVTYTAAAEKENTAVATRYNKVSDMPTWAQEEIQALVDSGALRGDENGNLNLSEDMMRMLIIIKRYIDSVKV